MYVNIFYHFYERKKNAKEINLGRLTQEMKENTYAYFYFHGEPSF